jgi:hypothetical protein
LSTTHEIEYNKGAVIIGAEFRQVDVSFDHDFGTHYEKAWEMVDGSFYAVLFIEPHNFEHSITFSKKDEDEFKEYLTQDFLRTVSAA